MVVTPAVVERPATQEELARTLGEAARAGHAVAPVGGGRASGMGGVLERCDLELRTARLDRIVEHAPADMVVTVEAGITLEALDAELARHNQFLPLDPFNSPGHSIGGLLATGWGGPLRMRFGSARDFLIGIRVALPDGTLATAGGRVVKNVSGYDLMKLHHGALGSLGVIVAASFKLFPRPLHDVTVEAHDGWDSVTAALATPLAPCAVELFHDGRVLARYLGSRDAVTHVTGALGWSEVDGVVWAEHSRRTFDRWARIGVPASELRRVLESLGTGAEWWASPAVGVAHWRFTSVDETIDTRRLAEASGGSLVLLSAPDDVKQKIGAWGTAPATIDVMRRLRDAFDPQRTLNPGRFVV
jgi:glycolate oxidase FAD binding subunit